MKNFKKKLMMAILGFAPAVLLSLTVQAEVPSMNAYKAWTLPVRIGESSWKKNNGREYKNGDCFETGIALEQTSPAPAGKHKYGLYMNEIPVYKWEVTWEDHKCIHGDKGEDAAEQQAFVENYFHIPCKYNIRCYQKLSPGWGATCAKCGYNIPFLIYSDEDNIRRVTQLPGAYEYDSRIGRSYNSFYYSLCPNEDPAYHNSMEQTAYIEHRCLSFISANKYEIHYDPNGGLGYMANSIHYAFNENSYEGEEVTPQTILSKNLYRRNGYYLAGWNTRPDGSGEWYAEEDQVWKGHIKDTVLSSSNGITINLYAIWQPCVSKLVINANGGIYEGQAVYSLKKNYGESYVANPAKLNPPTGYTLRLNGGSYGYAVLNGTPVTQINGTRSFKEWAYDSSFAGTLNGNTYTFTRKTTPEQADIYYDTLTALYNDNPITLPGVTMTVSDRRFTGWYYDAACTDFAGKAGDQIRISGNTTIYAGYSHLTLNAVSNYTANDGKGAVDLSWYQDGAERKTYELFQTADPNIALNTSDSALATYWTKLHTATGNAALIPNTATTVTTVGESKTVSIAYSGTYQIDAYGAVGNSYDGNTGGYGGHTGGTVYLEAGDVITITNGGRGTNDENSGYNGGGRGSVYGNGGGMTVVSSEQKGLLFIAGGGGAATEQGAGGAGGMSQSLVDTGNTGGSGQAGGGGGYQGGNAGEYIVHHHTSNCYVSGTESPEENAERFESFYANHTASITLEGESLYKNISSTTASASITATIFPSHESSNESSKSTIQVGNSTNYFATPYQGTITIDYETTTWGNIEGIQPTFTLYYVHEDETVSSQSCEIMSLGPTSCIDWDDENTVVCWHHWNSRNVYVGNIIESDFGTIKRINDIKDTVTKPCGSTRDRWCPHYEVIGEHFEGRIRLGYGVMWTCSQPACSSDPYHGVDPFYTIKGKWKFEIPAGVRGIYCSQQEKYFSNAINVNNTIGKITYSYNITQCGYGEGEIVSSESAYGGSNYYNSSIVSNPVNGAGENNGDGYTVITPVYVGYIDTNSMNDVSAPDLAKPNKIQDIVMTAAGEYGRKFVWNQPADNGTAYYHCVISYIVSDVGPTRTGLTSNVTENVLITGIKGYYYAINTYAGYNIGRSDAFISGKTDLSIDVSGYSPGTYYLHIAAVDKAGNIADTAHRSFDINGSGPISDPLTFPVYTGQISVSSDTANIYQISAKEYYVRADGETPVILENAAWISGNSNLNYQINKTAYNAESTSGTQKISTTIPFGQNLNTNYEYSASEMETIFTQPAYFSTGSFTKVSRTNQCKTITIRQKFVPERNYNGSSVFIFPTAEAFNRERNETMTSNITQDRNNGVTLILDGTPPVIYGTEYIAAIENAPSPRNLHDIVITAIDGISGLKKLTVTLLNEDIYLQQTWESTTGSITIPVTDDQIFNGKLSFTVTAEDNVGNVSTYGNAMESIDLRTSLAKELPNHDRNFKAGQAGFIYLTSMGYIDKIEIIFPDGLEQLYRQNYTGTMGTTIVYDFDNDAVYNTFPEVLATGIINDKYEFWVPVYTAPGTYRATIIPYKNGEKLNHLIRYEEFYVDGTILDDFKTVIIR